MQKIDKNEISDILSLTPLQEGMLFHYLGNPSADVYFEQLSVEVSGRLDIRLFERAWAAVIETNEALRACFAWEKLKNPVQIVLKQHSIKPVFHDLSALAPQAVSPGLAEIKNQDRQQEFDLRQTPFRVSLCKTGQERYVIILSNHHILFDGWSTGLIVKEFLAAYRALSQGRQPGIPAKPPLKEYVKAFQARDKDKERAFWFNYLQGFSDLRELSIKTGGQRQPEAAPHVYLEIEAEMTARIKDFAQKHKVTPALLLNAAWGLLIQRYNYSDDVLFGTTLALRPAHINGVEEMVGLMINTLPFRVRHRPLEKVRELLARLDREWLERDAFAATPLAEIRDYAGLSGQAELFDHLLVVENYPLDRSLKQDGGPLVIRSYSLEEKTHYDLTLGITLEPGIAIRFIFAGQPLERDAVIRLAGHFQQVLQDITRKADRPVDDLEILTIPEKEQILTVFNDTETAYPVDRTICGLFADQVQRTPDRLALSGETVGANGHSPLHHALSYSELDRRSDDLAQTLIEKGVLPNTIVGIQIERSIEMIIGILGILKSGGAYLPIDPELPPERIDYMLADSGAEIVLDGRSFEIGASAPLSNRLALYPVPERSRGAGRSRGAERSVAAIPGTGMLNRIAESPQFVKPQAKLSTVLAGSEGDWCVSSAHRSTVPTYLAYVIYTSGSTGRPKGVPIDHGSLVNLCSWHNRTFTVTPDDHASQFASQCFDASVWEIFPYLVAGACLTIVPSSLRSDIAAINTFFEKYGITIAFLPTQAAELFMDLDNRSLRLLLTGGDKLRRLRSQRYKLVNNYGPTENTVVSTSLFLDEKMPDARLPIGRPIDNTGIFILSRWGSDQPVGIAGELWISGPGLARGYLNNPELTAEKFRPSPLASTKLGGGYNGGRELAQRPSVSPLSKHGEGGVLSGLAFPSPHGGRGVVPISGRGAGVRGDRLYRTGDLCRWLSDGTVEFLGRIDFQVKIRGYRIELGEIEAQLSKHPAIKEAVVLARDAEAGEKYLCAYLVLDPAKPTDIQAIRDYLAKKLPAYMVPAHFVCLEQLPLSPNGKVDRKALPEPQTALEPASYIPPQDEIEWGLAEIWAEILGIEKNNIGTDRNFFELGGHSLKATIMIARINKHFAIDIPLAEIFKISPTIQEIASFIRTVQVGGMSAETRQMVKKEFII